MKIIPVIDLRDGAVVHARQGQRDQYQPVQSILSQSSDCFAIIDGFLSVYPFDTFYIADLNAILGQPDYHNAVLTQILANYPTQTFWLDRGYCTLSDICLPSNCLPVLGSESCAEKTVPSLKNPVLQYILSLDFSVTAPLGPKCLFDDTKTWPNDIIIMTLAQVGSQQGPDWLKLADYCKRFPEKNFIAAGGVRHAEDLLALEKMGIHSALLASSLHSGAIQREDLETLQNQ